MLVRILTGICLLLAALPILYWSDTFLLVLAVSLLSFGAVFEMLRCLGAHKNFALSFPSYAIALAVPAMTRLISGVDFDGLILFALVYVYGLYVLAHAMFSKGKIPFSLASRVFLSTAYIVCGFSCLIATRDLKEHGLFFLIMIVVVAFATDIFAYFSGMLFGRRKLIPEVSPKKTVEGAIGGTLISAAAFVGCGVLYARWFDAARPHILSLFLCGAAISAVAQIGDLIASFIKRECEIKDYGKIFPGHGGIMDRFDSVIAVAPVMYLLLANPSMLSIFK